MRILHLAAGEKWTGVAAVVNDWVTALVDAGVEAQLAFIGGGHLAGRVMPAGWVRPLLSRSHGPAATVRDLLALRRTLAREPFDVLHVHGSHEHYLAALAAAGTDGRIRIVRTLHHARHARPDPILRAVFRRTDAWSYANRRIAADFGRGGPVFSPLVDPDVFAPGARPETLASVRLPPGVPMIGTVGKLARARGHEEAIAATAPLLILERAAALHVGMGAHRPELEARAAALGVAERNLWAGFQVETLPVFYRAMDLFLFTASGSQQGQRAILEAMASGLPVVALDVPGVEDLFTDGVEGFIVSDVAGLTRALARLLDDPGLRATMGGAARARALGHGRQRFAKAASAFYADVLARRSGARERLTGSPGLPSGATSARPSDAIARSVPPDR